MLLSKSTFKKTLKTGKMSCFLDQTFTPISELLHLMGQKRKQKPKTKPQVLFWFDTSSYRMLFRECVD